MYVCNMYIYCMYILHRFYLSFNNIPAHIDPIFFTSCPRLDLYYII